MKLRTEEDDGVADEGEASQRHQPGPDSQGQRLVTLQGRLSGGDGAHCILLSRMDEVCMASFRERSIDKEIE